MTWLLIIPFVLYAAYKAYANIYFSTKKFLSIKDSISAHTFNCNELNDHIENLKLSYILFFATDYGHSEINDASIYNMRRKLWIENKYNRANYNCSSAVCKNARDQPFKYLCKYFNIKPDEKNLGKFESTLNKFSAAEQGKILLKNEQNYIMSGINKSIPTIIIAFSSKRVIRELGFKEIDLTDLYFPIYTFRYVSPGGNSSMHVSIKLDISNLNKFVEYINDLVKFRKTIAGQRALMTSVIREKIKNRDNHTCQICKISAHNTRNLLLEIDHIVPLSKGGITSENNLQTLCWKCNRTKGASLDHLGLLAQG